MLSPLLPSLQRALWKHYFKNTDAVIFVLDSNDRDRISECKSELHRLLGDDELRDAAILVLANKQDIPGAMSVEEVRVNLDFGDFKDRNIGKFHDLIKLNKFSFEH